MAFYQFFICNRISYLMLSKICGRLFLLFIIVHNVVIALFIIPLSIFSPLGAPRDNVTGQLHVALNL